VGGVVGAVVFEVGEQRGAEPKDGVIADVAGGDGVQDFGPHRPVDAFVLVGGFGLDLDDLSHTLHDDYRPPVTPPSMMKPVAIMKRDSSEARYSAACATSSGRPSSPPN